MIKVFISYSHDSDEHRERVLSLSERLRGDGIVTILDRYVERGSPPEGWPRWMLDKLDEATHVLCVCTETYYRRFRGHEIPGKGKGVDWEGAVITQELYNTHNVSNKFIPVLFAASDECNIPQPLRMQTCYLLNSKPNYQSLYDALLDQSGIEPGAVGELKRKPRAIGKPLTFDPTPQTTGQDTSVLHTVQRRDELSYLEDLINRHYAKHKQCYVALEAKERQTHTLESTMQTVINADVILKAFNMATMQDERVQEKTYDDALQAYRDLKNRPVRRLAVLGEPGAGKSFSLQRIAVEYAQQAVSDDSAPVPVLVPLGAWIKEDEPLETFIAAQLGQLGSWFSTLYQQRRTVLMLDGLNEIPPGQRQAKIEHIKTLARDERFVSVVVSCREKDFTADCHLPFDTLLLQPLRPSQILTFLKRMYALKNDVASAESLAEDRFWQLAGGQEIREVWEIWQQAGADLELFWSAEAVPKETPNVYAQTTGQLDNLWREVRFNPRNLLHLASNPYLLFILTELPQVPRNRAQLFQGFLTTLYLREKTARDKRQDTVIPDYPDWETALIALAETMQRAAQAGTDDGAQTSLPRQQCPDVLDQTLLDFSIDASVLQIRDQDIRFTHQLLQEYLASRLLLDASRDQKQPASTFWPQASWWTRSGWEVVAEIAAESCGDDAEAQIRLIEWLAKANPEVACTVWQHLGQIDLPQPVLTAIADLWLPRMTDITQQPEPKARAAIGRALGGFGLDRRQGTGLRADGLPDIDWVNIPSSAFIYQNTEHPPLPAFYIARYPITNAQFQAFIDAGGYRDDQWWQGWQGLHQRYKMPGTPRWIEPNAPRETVNWFEAVAFCRWLSAQLGYAVSLPTEQQWERAARGTQGLEYPWGNAFQQDFTNGNQEIGRTSAVGLYPQAASSDGVLDMAGNVWEWCLNEYLEPNNRQLSGDENRVVRGGSWFIDPDFLRASFRNYYHLDFRDDNIGFRVLCSSPIE